MSLIKSNPVTAADINAVEKTFGPDIATLKGMPAHREPAPAAEGRAEAPQPRDLIAAQRSVALHLDGTQVNGAPLLTAISKSALCQAAQRVKSGQAPGTCCGCLGHQALAPRPQPASLGGF